MTFHERFLNSTTTTDDENDKSDDSDDFDDSKVLRNTIRIYGSLFILILFLFCWLRRRFPIAFNVRGWVTEIQTPLAENQFRFFSWMWQVCMVRESDFAEECGLDALCLIRILQMGFRLSVVGIFNALWLIPVYVTADDPGMVDKVVRTTVAHVPSGSVRLIATVLASYIFFGYAMHLILQEFDWYIEQRHRFLRRLEPRNFSVFVRNIPVQYRTNAGLEIFFRGCFSAEDVLEAQIPLKTPSLAKLITQREATLARLEHAVAIYEQSGERPTHQDRLLDFRHSGVDSIDKYTRELSQQNAEVAEKISRLEAIVAGSYSARFDSAGMLPPLSSNTHVDVVLQEGQLTSPNLSPLGWLNRSHEKPANPNSEKNETASMDYQNSEETKLRLPEDGNLPATGYESMAETDTDILRQDLENAGSTSPSNSETIQRGPNQQVGHNMFLEGIQTANAQIKSTTATAASAVKDATRVVGNVTSTATNVVGQVASDAVTMILGGEDGEVLPSGFVVFKKLSTANAARQMIHHDAPFTFETTDAPDPEDVFWGNMFRSHEDLQIGRLLSLGMTVSLCLFWTIPISFIASLANVAALREDSEFVDTLLNNYPWMTTVLEQSAPLLIVLLNAALPTILRLITLFEGPISTAKVTASTFVKLAAFVIIQTFFVSAISGSIWKKLNEILNDFQGIVDILAESLPAQSTYFLQIIIVNTVRNTGMELLRVVPLGKAAARQFVGPRLTEKERQTTFLGLRPLNDPQPFLHADVTSQMVLYFMVLFVYTVISPMTGIITAACFLFMGTMYRHQFIYNYPKKHDSGGQLWAGFIQVMMWCVLIAELTILGLLGLKKSISAGPLFVPLLVGTVIFMVYMRERHFEVAKFLPTHQCLFEDLNRDESFDFASFHGTYLQPELAVKRELVPEITIPQLEEVALLSSHTEN